MSPTWQMALTGLGLITLTMIGLWLISLPLRNASIVDPFWGTGFVLLTWLAYAWQTNSAPRSFLLCGMVTVWGLRLTCYLLWRNVGHGEDDRYAAMRRHHGVRFWWVSLLTVFLLQAVILWVVALPILMTGDSHAQSAWNAGDLCGVLLWSVGLTFETVGDWQLARFKSNPANAGKVLRHGLWRYTRHPNYFGDFCVWWGIYAVAVAGGAWWTIFSPLLMTILLMRISGVTLLESTIQDRRPDYAEHRKTTNAFFPWFPRPDQRRPVT